MTTRTACVFLALTSAVSAQSARSYQASAIPAAMDKFLVTDEDPGFWAATLKGTPNRIIGGSLFTNRTAIIETTNPLRLLPIGSSGVPEILIVEERTSSGYTYHGLSATGRWVAMKLTNKAKDNSVVGTEAHTGFLEETTNKLHVFYPFKEVWTSVQLSSSTPNVDAANASILVVDGTKMIGISAFYTKSAEKTASKTPAFVVGQKIISDEKGNGAFHVLETGVNEFSAYSAWTNQWTTIATVNAAASVPWQFHDRIGMFADEANKLSFYSPMNDKVIAHAISSRTNVTGVVEDGGAWFYDAGSRVFSAYKSGDGLIESLPAPSFDATKDVWYKNEHCMFRRTGSTTFNAIGFNLRGGKFRSVDIGSETLLNVSRDDDSLLIVTDQAAYAFSATIGRFGPRQPYIGTFKQRITQDMQVAVLSDREIVAFSGRAGKWARMSVSSTATVRSDDGIIVVTDGSKRSAFAFESEAFLTIDVGNLTPVYETHKDNRYTFIADDPKGGSRIFYYASTADEWSEVKTSTRLTAADVVAEQDDGVVIATPTEMLSLTSWPNVNMHIAWPYNNRRFPPVPGMPADFVAAGPMNGAGALLIGSNRINLTLPGFIGSLRVDPTQAFATLPLAMDARGTAKFTLPLPVFGFTLFFQTVLLDPSTKRLHLSQPSTLINHGD